MTGEISPDDYDTIVIGSGLPECLVAASLVKSGKSVLIIDAVDTYGTDFASFTPAALQDYVKHQTRQCSYPASRPDGDPDDSSDGGTAPHPSRPQSSGGRPQQPEEHEHSMPASSPVSGKLPPNSRLLRLEQRPLPLSGIRLMSVATEEGAEGAAILKDRRRYILDLAPKLVYQAEALVDLLVHCRCHHYLEFKAVEGSYILQDGALQSVPAGRADIFRDRRLGLADKRLLMRFIQGCMEARTGQGHLKDALASAQPLAQVLQAEGLSPRLQEVILYGIAMCDTAQDPLPAPPTARTSTGAGAAAGAAAGVSTASTAADASPPATSSGRLMTGAEGGAALELFTGSQGRFGQAAAFMVPSYGSGSVAEAFVRLCAVHGAVTVLRQPVQALLVATGTPQASGQSPQPPAAEDVPGVADAGSAGVVPLAGGGQESSSGGSGDQAGPYEDVSQVEEETGTKAEVCVGIVTAAGQVVRCGSVVAGVSPLSCLEGAGASTFSSALEYVSRAVVVLDGPLQPAASPSSAAPTHTSAAQQAAAAPAGSHGSQSRSLGPPPPSLATVVVPPRCPGVASGGNPHPVRALQQGASTSVCPAGRFLLYLSTPATSTSSYEDLRPTLDLLADTSALRDVTDGTAAGAAAEAGPAAAEAMNAASSGAPTSSSPSTDLLRATTAAAAATAAHPGPQRPRALLAWFYRQPVLHNAVEGGAGMEGPASLAGTAGPSLVLPDNVLALPGVDASLAGYNAVLRATETVYRSAFPGATWLAEADFTPPAADGEEDGGGSGSRLGAAAVDEDDDAISELSAAVARLKDA